jgi:hypothetical protein
MVTTYSFNGERSKPAEGEWVITDWTEDLALDCNTEAVLGNLCNNFGTLIKQLISAGIIKGSVATT